MRDRIEKNGGHQILELLEHTMDSKLKKLIWSSHLMKMNKGQCETKWEEDHARRLEKLNCIDWRRGSYMMKEWIKETKDGLCNYQTVKCFVDLNSL